MRKILLLSAIWTAAAHAVTAQDIARNLDAQHASQGTFTQTRHLRGIADPIISSGSYQLSENQLLWNLQNPFPVKLKITQDGIFQEQNGQWQLAQQNNTARQTKLFLGLLSGDWHPLESSFTIQADGTEDRWRITLTPKTAALKQIFTDITLQGTRHSVDRITVREAQGDASELELKP